jgi:hypothetical protein
MRSAMTIVAVVAAAVIASGATAAYFIVASQSLRPRPALLTNLPGSGWEAEGDAFRQRVLRAVPIGSPESELLSLLSRQGFRRGWEATSSSEREAYYDDRFKAPALFCGSAMNVWWSVDKDDRITSFRARWSDDGCP